jgi:hypothetical protein
MTLVEIESFGQPIVMVIDDVATHADISGGEFTLGPYTDDWFTSLGDDERWREYERLADRLYRAGIITM